MRHFVTLLFFCAAALGYTAGYGPLFFGAPLLGWVFLAAGVTVEFVAARRVADHDDRET